MTPNAITPAAGGGSTASRQTPKSRPAGHRARLRKQTVPRRVSGPAGGAEQARATGSTTRAASSTGGAVAPGHARPHRRPAVAGRRAGRRRPPPVARC